MLVCLSVCLSVTECVDVAPTVWICVEFDVGTYVKVY